MGETKNPEKILNEPYERFSLDVSVSEMHNIRKRMRTETQEEWEAKRQERYEEAKKTRATGKKVLKRMFSAFVILGLLTVVIPSKQTMYLMAGAYAGQETYTSEVGQKALKVLDSKLEKYIEELK